MRSRLQFRELQTHTHVHRETEIRVDFKKAVGANSVDKPGEQYRMYICINYSRTAK